MDSEENNEEEHETNPEDHEAFNEIFGISASEDEIIHGNEPVNWRREYWEMRKRAITYQKGYDAILANFSLQQEVINEMREQLFKNAQKISEFTGVKLNQN